ncbi:hypothetical protein ACH0CG_05940 [Microbacterium sp. 179-I 1D1 NHS]|uniref:hypothetical protein n=1 Tax=Microbacterium sp. 179-I 1D1 NHS TaxID=3374298 RepID=UPI0038794380
MEDRPDGVPSPASTEIAGSPAPDDLIVRTADTELRLESLPEEAGYEGMPDDIPAITGDDLFVFVRQDGWMLFAEQRGGDVVGCDMDVSEPEITDLGKGWWKVANRSEADTYALWLQAGSGPGLPIGGTVGWSQAYVRWTTTTTFDVPATSSLDVTRNSDGDGGSVELHLHDLTTPFDAVKASVALRGAGQDVDLDLSVPDWACDQPGDLTLFSRLSPEQMSTLGADDAVDYDIGLLLDGTTHTARGTVREASSAEPKWAPALP